VYISLFKKIKYRLSWLKEDISWFFFKRILENPKYVKNNSFTIGITTFMDRFENCLKPLVKKVSILFPHCQIIIIANGHVKSSQQSIYLEKIVRFCKSFNNIELFTFQEPRGLSHLWNHIIKSSQHSKILMLNDDIKIKMKFAKFIDTDGILTESIATINSTWSNFLISKEIINRIGLFEERLLEIGGEDDDYIARLAIVGIYPINYKTNTICNLGKKPKINSYGKDPKNEGNYSKYNTDFIFNKKWKVSKAYFDGAVYIPNRQWKYWKLRESDEN
jgi:hypothetical protein